MLQLPRATTASGKVQKFVLRQRLRDGWSADAVPADPCDNGLLFSGDQ